MKPKIAETVIDRLRAHTGVNLDYYRREFLEKRIELRMNDLDIKSYENYIEFLSQNPLEVDKFLEKFTVNYTYFFRNFEVFERIKEILLFSNRNLKRKIKIWSAPCATGDEPYSLGILIEEIKKIYPRFPDYSIIASDIDKAALNIAKKGVYHDTSLQEIPNIYQKNYFNQKVGTYGVEYIIDDKIKSKVSFVEEDIIEKHKIEEQYDIIFCRNFFIYIDRQSREKLINILEKHLLEGGLLVLGKIETINDKGTQLKLLDGKNQIYIKNDLKHSDFFKPLSIKKCKEELKPKEVTTTPSSSKSTIKRPKRLRKPKPSFNKEIKKPKGLSSNVGDQSKTVISREESVSVFPIDVIEEDLPNKVDVSSEFQKKLHEIKIKKQRLNKREKSILKKEFELQQKERELNQREGELDEKFHQIEKIEAKLQTRFKERIEREKQLKDQIFQLERILHKVKQKRKLQESSTIHSKAKANDSLEKDVLKVDSVEIIAVLEEDDYIFEKEVVLTQNQMILVGNKPEFTFTHMVKVENIGSDFLLIIWGNVSDVTSIIHLSSFNNDEIENNLKFNSFLKVIKEVYKNDTKLESYIIGGMLNMLNSQLNYSESIKLIRNKLNAVGIFVLKEDVGGFSDRAFYYDINERIPYVKKSWEFDYREFT